MTRLPPVQNEPRDVLLRVADSPLFARVLQVPIVLHADDQEIHLIVSSRDEHGASRLIRIRCARARGLWGLVEASILLEAKHLGPDCVGVMGGSVSTHGGGPPVLLGNAYRRGRQAAFSSALFAAPLDRPGDVTWLSPATGATFQAVPSIVAMGSRRRLVYSSAPGALPGLTAFPPAYGIYAADLDLMHWRIVGSERPWWWPRVGRAAVTKVAQEDGLAAAWVSQRGSPGTGSGYRLIRLRLGAVLSVLLVLSSCAYPDVAPGIGVFASAGAFGEDGIVMLPGLGD